MTIIIIKPKYFMVSKLLHFMGQYNTNTKFSHAIFGKLRIYFERSTKLFSPVNLLGSLFKNSKWTSFQTQNIKLVWLNDLIYTLLSILIFLFIVFNFKIFAGIKALVYKYTWNFSNHLLPNITYMFSLFIYLLSSVYCELCFSKQVDVKSTSFNLSKKKKIFNEDYFLYKTLLSWKSERIKNIDFFKNEFKRKLRLKKINSNSYLTKYNNYFFESNYTLNNNFYKEQTLNLNLEELNKLKNFNNDLIIKDNIIFKSNNLAKQQRWLTNNFMSSNKIIQDVNKHTLLKNFIENPLYQSNLLNVNIWSSTKLSALTNEATSLSSNNRLNKLISLNNTFSESQFYLNQRYSILNNLQSNLFLNKFQNQVNPKVLNNTINFNFLYTMLFNKNFNQNTLTYYPSFLFLKKNFYIDSGNTYSPLFYNLNTVDFLQKQDINLIINLNTTSIQKKDFFVNKNYSYNNYKI